MSTGDTQRNTQRNTPQQHDEANARPYDGLSFHVREARCIGRDGWVRVFNTCPRCNRIDITGVLHECDRLACLHIHNLHGFCTTWALCMECRTEVDLRRSQMDVAISHIRNISTTLLRRDVIEDAMRGLITVGEFEEAIDTIVYNIKQFIIYDSIQLDPVKYGIRQHVPPYNQNKRLPSLDLQC